MGEVGVVSMGRHVQLAVLLLTASAVAGCLCGLPLIWDGAYQFVLSLHQQHPFVYLTRFHTWLLWWPCVGLSRLSHNLPALLLAYGLPFLAAPALSLGLSWQIIRRHRPELIVWAAFGVTAAVVPGQVFVINDSIWQQTLAWPLLLAMFVPLSPVSGAIIVTVGMVQLVHQVGVFLLAICFIFGILATKITPAARDRRWQIRCVGAILFLAVAKTIWVSSPYLAGRFFDSYAAQQATWTEAMRMFHHGVWGLPLAGLACTWAAAILILRGERERWIWVGLALGASAWMLWAAQPAVWVGAIDYRRWVVPMAMPFYGCAFVDAIKVPSQPSLIRARSVLALAVIFAAVLGLQSWQWHGSVRRLMAEVNSGLRVVVTPSDVPWIRGTPLDHWGLTALVMAQEGPTPRHYFAYDEACRAALFGAPPQVALWSLYHISPEPGAACYYDHRPLLDSVNRSEFRWIPR